MFARRGARAVNQHDRPGAARPAAEVADRARTHGGAAPSPVPARTSPQKAGERADLGRHLAARGVHQVDVGRGQVPLGQHLAQAPRGQRRSGLPQGALHDALAIERPGQGRAAIVAAQGAMDLDGFLAQALACAPAQAPAAIGVVAFPDHDAAVGLQVGGLAWLAVDIQVGRRGAEHAPVGQQQAGGEGGVRRVAEAHHGVEALFDQVDGPVRQMQLHLYLGVGPRKGGQRRRQPLASEAQGTGQGQGPRAVARAPETLRSRLSRSARMRVPSSR